MLTGAFPQRRNTMKKTTMDFCLRLLASHLVWEQGQNAEVLRENDVYESDDYETASEIYGKKFIKLQQAMGEAEWTLNGIRPAISQCTRKKYALHDDTYKFIDDDGEECEESLRILAKCEEDIEREELAELKFQLFNNDQSNARVWWNSHSGGGYILDSNYKQTNLETKLLLSIVEKDGNFYPIFNELPIYNYYNYKRKKAKDEDFLKSLFYLLKEEPKIGEGFGVEYLEEYRAAGEKRLETQTRSRNVTKYRKVGTGVFDLKRESSFGSTDRYIGTERTRIEAYEDEEEYETTVTTRSPEKPGGVKLFQQFFYFENVTDKERECFERVIEKYKTIPDLYNQYSYLGIFSIGAKKAIVKEINEILDYGYAVILQAIIDRSGDAFGREILLLEKLLEENKAKMQQQAEELAKMSLLAKGRAAIAGQQKIDKRYGDNIQKAIADLKASKEIMLNHINTAKEKFRTIIG